MIHISRTEKGEFQVTNVAKNNEPLKPSETLKQKQSCWVNIKSEMRSCYGGEFYALVQDNTGKYPIVWMVGAGKKVKANGVSPQKPYVPKHKPVKKTKGKPRKR